MSQPLDPEYERALDLWIQFGRKADIPPAIRNEIHRSFYKWLVTSVLKRAVLDLRKGVVEKVNQVSAYKFLNSNLCRLFCNDIGFKFSELQKKIEVLWQQQQNKK